MHFGGEKWPVSHCFSQANGWGEIQMPSWWISNEDINVLQCLIASQLAPKISDYIRIYRALSPSVFLLEMSHYSIFLLYHLIMRCSDVALTCTRDACICMWATRVWQVDGSPRRWTPPVIRTQMALQWLIIDAANMWQLLINTHAGRIAQTRTALTIRWKPKRGERWEGKRGREVEGEEKKKIIR